MKLLTVPAWHPDQWVVPVATVPTERKGRVSNELHRVEGFGMALSAEFSDVPFRGRIAIAVPCECMKFRCKVPNCVDVGCLWMHGCYLGRCNGLGHLIVASAVVDDCVPIISESQIRDRNDLDPNPYLAVAGPACPVQPCVTWLSFIRLAVSPGHYIDKDRSDALRPQLAYATFTPGQHALILSDVQPTTERCPACDGSGLGDDSQAWSFHGCIEPGSIPPCGWCDFDKVCQPIPVESSGEWSEWAP